LRGTERPYRKELSSGHHICLPAIVYAILLQQLASDGVP
jgi:hypothetical protein